MVSVALAVLAFASIDQDTLELSYVSDSAAWVLV